jgi:outer membrane protein assembly factor BamB
MSRAAVVGWFWVLVLLFLGAAAAPAADDATGPVNKAFKPVQDEDIARNLEILPDYMGGDGWPTVIAILQDIFDADEDVFLPTTRTGPDGKEIPDWTGARAEALRILAELPKPGRAAYHAAANAPARALLETARKQGDWQMAAAVARRFPLTPAGIEAARLLGTHFLDRGDPEQAVRWFRLWQQRQPQWESDGLGVYLAWLAHQRAGHADQAKALWQKLQKHHPDGLKVGSSRLTLANMKEQMAPLQAVAAAMPAPAWPVFAGNPTRTGTVARLPGAPALAWSATTPPSPVTAGLLEDAMRCQEERPQPVLSGSFPIIAGDKIVCRTQGGIQALDVATGKPVWDRPLPTSLDRLLNDESSRALLEHWLGIYLQYHPHILLENTSLGCLSGDGARVYAVDDLPVLPFAFRAVGKKYNRDLAPHDPVVAAAMPRSRLVALDAATGKAAWEVGRQDGDGFLDRCHFLGPPLPVEGKLYGVAEHKSDLCLYCLAPDTGKLLWKQRLGSAQYQVTQDGMRRLQAVHLSYDRGLLICPTNAGAVVAYDLHTSSLAWVHIYRNKTVWNGPKLKGLRPARELEIEAMPNTRNQLQVSAPVVAEGKVILASADSPVVECLRLADGEVLWKVERTTDDLFLAGVHEGRVLLVGRKACRALSAADGKALWSQETGLPSGQGVFAGKTYVLPVRGEGQAKTATLVSVDLATAEVKHLPELPGQAAAGNLLVMDGRVISQTVTTVTAWAVRESRRK